jgi:hypothetical protein
MTRVFLLLVGAFYYFGIVILLRSSRFGGGGSSSSRELSTTTRNSVFDFLKNKFMFEFRNLKFNHERTICDLKMPTNWTSDEKISSQRIN